MLIHVSYSLIAKIIFLILLNYIVTIKYFEILDSLNGSITLISKFSSSQTGVYSFQATFTFRLAETAKYFNNLKLNFTYKQEVKTLNVTCLNISPGDNLQITISSIENDEYLILSNVLSSKVK